MDAQDKVRIIDEELGFLLDEPFMDAAGQFPSPDDVIEDWYLTATAFRNVRESQHIPDEHREALHLLVEDAISEYRSAVMLGEPPDTEEELGVGYEGYDVPEGFAANYQAVIWKEVLAVFGADSRPRDLTIETK